MADNGKILGVDFSEFTGRFSIANPQIVGLLYYGDSQLTDHYHIKNVYVIEYDETYKWGKFTNVGEHFMYVVGSPKVGDLLTTSYIKGVAIVTDKEEVAFARVTRTRTPMVDESYPVVGGVYATFL